MIKSFHRPTVATVDLDNLIYNLQQVKSHLPKETDVWAVVKANAYGHGAVPVAKKLSHHVVGFCLSNLDEALELRDAGIDIPLLVLGVVPAEDIAIAQSRNIQLTLASQEWLETVLAMHKDLSGLQFHLKVDSGMGRIGFKDSQSINQAVQILQAHHAEFSGIFTHFATADEADNHQFQEQLLIFQEILKHLPHQPRFVHASNSAAAIWHSETVFSAVRLGDVLYGLNPSGRSLSLPYSVKPVLSLTTELVHVKELPDQQPIGYGATYKTKGSEWIATLPIGYADGLTRDMQGFYVVVDQQPCEIVGRISMDQTTVRLPRAYPLGTPVVLIGEMGNQVISVQDWADYRSTINYEVVCLLSDRIPRVYH